MIEIQEHTVRVLDQEIDTIAICPASPHLVLVGTYSLIRQEARDIAIEVDEPEEQSAGTSSRIGSLRILPIDANIPTTISGRNELELARIDVPCAVLDVRFCPHDATLVAAATSIGEIRFFKVEAPSKLATSESRSISITPVGMVNVCAEVAGDKATVIPLITQIAWTKITRCETEQGSRHYLAACDTSGKAHLVRVFIPNLINAGKDTTTKIGSQSLPFASRLIHKHLCDLEAWTIATVSVLPEPSTLWQVLFSGGDDSCLIASAYQIDTAFVRPNAEHADYNLDAVTSPRRICLDKNTHTAGVVAILPLDSTPGVGNLSSSRITLPRDISVSKSSIPVLTGSYDQRLRLYLLDTEHLKMQLVTDFELELDGGVWRIALLDNYVSSEYANYMTRHYVLLISAMHAGAYIVRLVSHEVFDTALNMSGWSGTIEARFTNPHTSMVYACDAQKVVENNDRGRVWRIVSTSFYDKRICVWHWSDQHRV